MLSKVLGKLVKSKIIPMFALAASGATALAAVPPPIARISCAVNSPLGHSEASGELAWVCDQIYGVIFCEYDVINAQGDLFGRRTDELSDQPRFRFGSPSTDTGPLKVTVEIFESKQVSNYVFNRQPADFDLQTALFESRTNAEFDLSDLIRGQSINVELPKLDSTGDLVKVGGNLECIAVAL